MTWVHPWALVLLPLALVPFWLKSRQGQMYSWLDIVPQDRVSDIANFAVKLVTALLLTSIVIAIAGPQGAEQQVQRIGTGAQTVLVIDRSVSNGKEINLYWIVLREPDDISIFTDREYDEENPPTAIALDRFFASLKTKYKAYEADNPAALQSAIQDIDSREKNAVQYTVTIAGRDYARDFIVLALVLGLLLLIVKNLRVHSWENA